MLMCNAVESMTVQARTYNVGKGTDEHSGEEKAAKPYEEQIRLLSPVSAHYHYQRIMKIQNFNH